jgi:homoserine dehydrogenase
VSAANLPAAGIDELTAADLTQARELGGAIKPVVYADLRRSGAPAAFVGPTFVPASHPLATLTGVANGVCLRSPYTSLFYSGPGAGPDVTAATILDDVVEVLTDDRELRPWHEPTAATVAPPAEARWLLCLRGRSGLPDASDTADLLATHDVWTSRITDATSRLGRDCRWILTLPCARHRLTRAIESLEHAAPCEVLCLPVLEDFNEQ